MEAGIIGVDQENTTDFSVATTPDCSNGVLFDGITYKVKIGLFKPTTKTILDDVSYVETLICHSL